MKSKNMPVFRLPSMLATDLAVFLAVVNFASAQTWTQTSAPLGPWTTIACSTDGIKLIAAGGHPPRPMTPTIAMPIYVSLDAGFTWIQTISPSNYWTAVACSADGTNLFAASQASQYGLNDGVIYYSHDAGSTWTQTGAPGNVWTALAVSADGSKVVATANLGGGGITAGDGLIYVSTNSGASWTPTSAPANVWFSIACSADGTKLVAGSSLCGIYTSADSGATLGANQRPDGLYVEFSRLLGEWSPIARNRR